MSAAKCGTCRWWDFYGPARYGYCRRHSPLVVLDGLSNEQTVWPNTEKDDWCGEHAPKGEA